jgi:3-oxoacyl-[acyl-carrier-protein] synthase II
MSERRVVVTGIGVISPVGNDLQTFWKSLIEGRSGIRRFEAFDSTNFDCKIAGEVCDFEAAKYLKIPRPPSAPTASHNLRWPARRWRLRILASTLRRLTSPGLA